MSVSTPLSERPSQVECPAEFPGFADRHGPSQSLARTVIDSESDGTVLISTVVRATGYDDASGFFVAFESFVFGGRFHGMTSLFHSSRFDHDALRSAIVEHGQMVARLFDCYLELPRITSDL